MGRLSDSIKRTGGQVTKAVGGSKVSESKRGKGSGSVSKAIVATAPKGSETKLTGTPTKALGGSEVKETREGQEQQTLRQQPTTKKEVPESARYSVSTYDRGTGRIETRYLSESGARIYEREQQSRAKEQRLAYQEAVAQPLREETFAKQEEYKRQKELEEKYKKGEYDYVVPNQSTGFENITLEGGQSAVAGKVVLTPTGYSVAVAPQQIETPYVPEQKEPTFMERVKESYAGSSGKMILDVGNERVGKYFPSVEAYKQSQETNIQNIKQPFISIMDLTTTKEQRQQLTETYVPKQAEMLRGTGEFYKGVSVGAYTELKTRPVSTAGTFVLGAGVGSIAKLASASRIGATAVKTAGSVGLGIYGASLVAGATTAENKGEYVGRELVKGSAFIGGMSLGARFPVKTRPAYMTKEWYVERITRQPNELKISGFVQGKGVKYRTLKETTLIDYTTPKLKAKGVGTQEYSDIVIKYEYPTKVQAYRLTGKNLQGTSIKVGGTTYQQYARTMFGEKYYVRTKIGSTGQATTQVFRGDKLLGRYTYTAPKPYSLTESRVIKKSDAFIQAGSRAREYEVSISTQKPIATQKGIKVSGELSTFTGTQRYAQVTKPYRLKEETLILQKTPQGVSIDTGVGYKVKVPEIKFVSLSDKTPQQAFKTTSVLNIGDKTIATTRTEYPATYLTLQSGKFDVYGTITITQPRSATARMFKSKRGSLELQPKSQIQTNIPKVEYSGLGNVGQFNTLFSAPTIKGKVTPFIVPMTSSEAGQTRQPITKPRAIPISQPINISKPINIATPSSKVEPVSVLEPVQVPVPIPISSPIQRIKQQQIQKQTEVTRIPEPLITGGARGGGITIPKPKTETTPFTLPKIEFGLFKEKKSKKQKKKEFKEAGLYTPSVEAQLFNVYGKKPKGYKSGLTIRPLIR